MTWEWLEESVVIAIHDAQLAEHGGIGGLRDEGLLRSALVRPQNLLAYGEEPDAGGLAAAFGFGLAQNHAFLDGDKRTAFVAMEAFLELNGYALAADDRDCIATFERLAAGKIGEADLAAWIRARISRAG
jgi:death-on-curing protein